MSRERAISREARHNLRHYALGEPVRFAGLLGEKAWRVWGGYFRGRDVKANAAELWLHRTLVFVALAGLIAGCALATRRRALLMTLLAALVACTALEVLFLAEARDNAPLMPVLLAAGAAGWVLAAPRLRALRPAHRDGAVDLVGDRPA
jgi:hypothetical protein